MKITATVLEGKGIESLQHNIGFFIQTFSSKGKRKSPLSKISVLYTCPKLTWNNTSWIPDHFIPAR